MDAQTLNGFETVAEGLDALAAAARAGEPGAFDELVRRAGGRMTAYATRVVGDRAVAEEAVQEALVRVYRFLPRYRDGNFIAWALRITHRACMDALKRERRTGAVHEPPATHDPHEATDIRAAVDAALATLPEQLRVTFLLHQQGLAYEDVAAILRVPVGTVRSRLHDARRRLRALLADTIHGGA